MESEEVMARPRGGEIPIASLAIVGLVLATTASFLTPSSTTWSGGRIAAMAALFATAVGALLWIGDRARRGLIDFRIATRAPRFEPALVFTVATCLLLPGVWGYTLIDPWEGHYAEVARRMLADSDWVHTKWQNEVFRSKPVLTFWLIASSLRFFGFAREGGFSGEFTDSDLVVLAIRLPFVLIAALGVSFVFWMLAQLLSRRTAWLFVLVVSTTTFFFSVARQAITDMPMVATTMIAVSCFAMAVERGDGVLQTFKFRRRLELPNASALAFFAVFATTVILFAAYCAIHFSHFRAARGVRVALSPALMIAIPMLIGLGIFWLSTVRFRITRCGQVWMFWFYFFVGVGVLAKGPPTLALAGLVCLLYLVFTGRWSLLRKLEIPRGILITLLVAVPWHVAMWLRDGPAFISQYVGYHMMDRFGKGALGDRGTFEYVLSQLGVGMWPWTGLVVVGFAALIANRGMKTTEQRTELLIGLWATASIAFFCLTTTKFHHYILPAVPACAVVVACWLGRLFDRRPVSLSTIALIVAVTALLTMELVGEQEKLIELYIFRYDRPWPSGPPWNLDLSASIRNFGIALCAGFALLAATKLRRIVIPGLLTIALAWLAWAGTHYMNKAAPHWGQGALHQTYYAMRNIHGVEVRYDGLAELRRQWRQSDRVSVQSVIPKSLRQGQQAIVRLAVPNVGLPGNRIDLSATVSSIVGHTISFQIDAGQRERITELIEAGTNAAPKRPPRVSVLADQLIAWELNWRGENFWSGGEIWGESKETQVVFNPYNGNKSEKFKPFIREPDKVGRTFYVITEAGRAKGLKGHLPTQRAKQSFELVDESSNKFTLVRFEL